MFGIGWNRIYIRRRLVDRRRGTTVRGRIIDSPSSLVGPFRIVYGWRAKVISTLA